MKIRKLIAYLGIAAAVALFAQPGAFFAGLNWLKDCAALVILGK